MKKNAGKQPKVTKKIRQYCSDLVENIDLGENLKKNAATNRGFLALQKLNLVEKFD